MVNTNERNKPSGKASWWEEGRGANPAARGKHGGRGVSGRPRLLVLTSTYPRWAGDPEPGFVHELARRLAEHYEVTVLCPHAPSAAPYEVLDEVRIYRYRYAPAHWETLVHQGGILANLARYPLKWLLVPCFVLAQLVTLLKLRRQVRPELIHAHWLLPQGIIAALAGAKPFVVTSHGADLFALRGRMFKWLRNRVVKRAAAVTVVSDAMRQRLLEESPGTKAFTMPMGVDFERRFTFDNTVARSTKNILFVGRLVEKKGLIYLVEAMPDVLTAHPDARLDIVGFGPERDRLLDRVQQLGLTSSVHFVGAVPQAELPRYYQSAAVFVAPFVEASGGDQEGLGLVVAEAIGCQCPVVVGDVPAVHDLIGDARDCMVPQRDARAIARALVHVMNDPDAALKRAEELRSEVKNRFSWGAVSFGYRALFNALLEEDDPGDR